jgi:Leucine-rich repeat (LRR) protein
MKKLLPLLIVSLLFYWGCEDTTTNEVTLWGEVYSIEDTERLSLHQNRLTGPIPPEIGNLTNLTYLDLFYNQLTGSIPSEIGNMTNLTGLRLNNNQLTGEIPESICDLNINWGDEFFNISNNLLCPPYPSCIEDYMGVQDTSGCD